METKISGVERSAERQPTEVEGGDVLDFTQLCMREPVSARQWKVAVFLLILWGGGFAAVVLSDLIRGALNLQDYIAVTGNFVLGGVVGRHLRGRVSVPMGK